MYRKNTAGQFICVQMILTATGAVATGLTLAARRCLDGTFAAATGTFTEDGTTGSYKFALSQADTNANDVSIIVTGTGAIPVCVNFVTTAADPTNATTFGLTNLDAAISTIPSANANADALLDRSNAVETAWTPRKVLRIMFAALGGKASGMGTATGVFRAGDDSKDRITATQDASGNRTAITLDGT